MMAQRMMFPIVLRGANLFWTTWFAMVVSSLVGQGEMGLVLLVGSYAGGVIFGQPLREVTQRNFAWNLPGLRAKTLAWILAFNLLWCVGFAFLVPHGAPLWSAFSLSAVLFAMGSALQTSRFTFVQIKPNFSLLGILFLISSCMQVNHLMDLLTLYPMASSVVFLGVFVVYLWVFGSREQQRRLLTTPFLALSNIFHAKEIGQRCGDVTQGDSKGPRSNWQQVLVPFKAVPWLKAVMYETLRARPLWYVLLFSVLVGFFLLSFFGYFSGLNQRPAWFLVVICALAFEAPMMLRSGMIYPLSRQQRFKVVYLGSLVETFLYSGVLLGLMVLINQMPYPPVTLPNGQEMTFKPYLNLDRILLVSWTIVPLLQYIRRSRGVHVTTFVVVMLMGTTGVVMLIHWLQKNYGQEMSSVEFLQFSGLALASQMWMYIRLKNHFLTKDLI